MCERLIFQERNCLYQQHWLRDLWDIEVISRRPQRSTSLAFSSGLSESVDLWRKNRDGLRHGFWSYVNWIETLSLTSDQPGRQATLTC